MEDLDQMLAKASIALMRDINSIVVEGATKKLSAASARDLVGYIKVLSDLQKITKDKGKELLKSTEEELKEIARELIK